MNSQNQSPFDPPPRHRPSAAPKRASDETMRAEEPRHPLRTADEYEEFEEEARLRIPESEYPDGFVMQWVTDSVFGRQETQHRARFERQGWVSVMSHEWNGKYGRMFMPEGHKGEIIMDGLVLMARPRAWHEKARMIERQRAFERVAIKEQQLRQGSLSQVTLDASHPTAVRSNVVNRSVEQIAVPG